MLLILVDSTDYCMIIIKLVRLYLDIYYIISLSNLCRLGLIEMIFTVSRRLEVRYLWKVHWHSNIVHVTSAKTQLLLLQSDVWQAAEQILRFELRKGIFKWRTAREESLIQEPDNSKWLTKCESSSINSNLCK